MRLPIETINYLSVKEIVDDGACTSHKVYRYNAALVCNLNHLPQGKKEKGTKRQDQLRFHKEKVNFPRKNY